MKRPLRLWASTLALGVFLYAPIVAVIFNSFNSARHGGPWQGFTWQWYLALLENREIHSALANTLILAAVSTALSTVLGTLLGFALNRYPIPGRSFILRSLHLPVFVPDIVLAAALLAFYGWVRQTTGWLELGMMTMILGHVTFQIPFVAVVIRSRLAGLDPNLEEAAHDLGATAAQTFWKVTFPLIWPAVLASALLAFTLSLDDFVVSFFTSGPGSTTLPIYIYSSVKRGVTPEVNALSSLLILASVIAAASILVLHRRQKL